MSRSIKKGPYVSPKLLKKVSEFHRSGSSQPIKTWERSSMIMPEMVGVTFAIHDGRKFIQVLISENMVGHRLGEFAPTRNFRGHSRNI